MARNVFKPLLGSSEQASRIILLLPSIVCEESKAACFIICASEKAGAVLLASILVVRAVEQAASIGIVSASSYIVLLSPSEQG